MYTCDDKMVSHPGHYISKNGMEVIDVIKEFTSNLTGIEATDTGNIIKYITRWKNKNGLQDLKKARWYLDHLIDEIESKEDELHPENEEETCSGCSSYNILWEDISWPETIVINPAEFIKSGVNEARYHGDHFVVTIRKTNKTSTSANKEDDGK